MIYIFLELESSFVEPQKQQVFQSFTAQTAVQPGRDVHTILFNGLSAGDDCMTLWNVSEQQLNVVCFDNSNFSNFQQVK